MARKAKENVQKVTREETSQSPLVAELRNKLEHAHDEAKYLQEELTRTRQQFREREARLEAKIEGAMEACEAFGRGVATG